MSIDEAVEKLIRIANARFSETESVEQMQAVFARYIASQSQSTEHDARAALVRAFVSRGVSAAFKTLGPGTMTEEILPQRPEDDDNRSPRAFVEQILQEYVRLSSS